jgi:hypothetical protein
MSLLGCSAVKTITVSVTPLPVLSFSASNTICTGQTVTLSVSGASSYSWSNGNTGTAITVSPSVTTIYSVTGTTNGCSSSSILTQVVSSCTDLNEILEKGFEISIYPNPAQSTFKINLPGTQFSSIKIRDIEGNLIFIKSDYDTRETISVAYFKKGLYLVEVSGCGHSYIRKLWID